MHPEVKHFIKSVRSKFWYKFRNKRVLELGSKSINGSPRRFFWFCKYTGVDLSHGKGVDMLLCEFMDTHDKYQTIVSTEMLEHDSTWDKSLCMMYERLEEGGLLIITCAGPHRAEHGTKRTTPEASPDTQDYYGNISREMFIEVLPPHLFDPYVLQYARGENDLQFYGIKKRPKTPTSEEIYKKLVELENIKKSQQWKSTSA